MAEQLKVLSPEEMAARPLNPTNLKVLSPEEIAAQGKLPAAPAKPAAPKKDTRNFAQRGLDKVSDWLGTLPDVPVLPVEMLNHAANNMARSQAQSIPQMAAHPTEHAPEIAAMIATLPIGGEGAAAAGPVVRAIAKAPGALKAAVGSLAGSVVREGTRLASGTSTPVQSVSDAAKSLIFNTFGQVVAEKLLGGPMRPQAGSVGAENAATWKSLEGAPSLAPISASTILGPRSGVLPAVAGGVESAAGFTQTGAHIGKTQNDIAQADILNNMDRAIGTTGPIPPPEVIGKRVQDALRTQETALTTAAKQEHADELARASNDIAAAKDFAQQAVDTLKAQVKALPSTDHYNPLRQQLADAKAALPATLKGIETLHKAALASIDKMPSAQTARSVRALLTADPEFVIKQVTPESVTLAKGLMTAAGDTATKTGIVDSWLDQQILRDPKTGKINLSGALDRINTAYKSGVLGTLLPGPEGTAIIERLRSLARLGANIKDPEESILLKMRNARLPAEAIGAALAATPGVYIQKMATAAAAGEGIGSVVTAMLRSPVTTKYFLEGVMEPDTAKSAISIARAVHLAGQLNADRKKKK